MTKCSIDIGPCAKHGCVHFTCPRCQAQHDRGYFNGVDVYRCLGCGYVGHGFHPDPAIDAGIGSEIVESQQLKRRPWPPPRTVRAMNILITSHAAVRYVERIRPDWTADQAFAALTEHAPAAIPQRSSTYGGQRLFSIAELGCVLVVKHDHYKRVTVAVTVLPEGPGADVSYAEEVARILEEERGVVVARQEEKRAEQVVVLAIPQPRPKGSHHDRALLGLEISALDRELAMVREHEKSVRHMISEHHSTLRRYDELRQMRAALLDIAKLGGAAAIIAQAGLEREPL